MKVINNGERDIILATPGESFTIPAAKGDGNGEMIPGTTEIPKEFLVSMADNAVVSYYFESNILEAFDEEGVEDEEIVPAKKGKK
jgi:hypothetical protein